MKVIKYISIFLVVLTLYLVYTLSNPSGDVLSSKSQAESIAKSKFNKLIMEDDPMVQPWKNASLGSSILVRTIDGDPSYWRVLVVMDEKVIGYIDVKNKKIPRYGFFYQNPEYLDNCPTRYPVLTAENAKEMAKPLLLNYTDFFISEPVYVHDGTVETKLAWMIEIKEDKMVISRIFITPKFVYERKGDSIFSREGVE